MSATERRVLVTGAGGLLGRYVVRELSEDWQVGGLDLLACDEGIHHTTGSIEDFSTVRAACEGCDAVVHVAARPNIWSGTGSEIVQTNLVGTWNVLEAA